MQAETMSIGLCFDKSGGTKGLTVNMYYICSSGRKNTISYRDGRTGLYQARNYNYNKTSNGTAGIKSAVKGST